MVAPPRPSGPLTGNREQRRPVPGPDANVQYHWYDTKGR